MTMGDAPSPYFLAQAKAKQKLETIHCLRIEDGTEIDDEEDIMDELGNTYAEIYARDRRVDQDEEERRQVLALLTNRLTDGERQVIDKCHDLEEIEVVVN